jgi:hypothetical protein
VEAMFATCPPSFTGAASAAPWVASTRRRAFFRRTRNSRQDPLHADHYAFGPGPGARTRAARSQPGSWTRRYVAPQRFRRRYTKHRQRPIPRTWRTETRTAGGISADYELSHPASGSLGNIRPHEPDHSRDNGRDQSAWDGFLPPAQARSTTARWQEVVRRRLGHRRST